MQPWWVAIVVAVIGGPLMWLLRRLDRRNTEQHNNSLNTLHRIEESIGRVDGKVDRLDARLDSHIDWHVDVDWKQRRQRGA